MKRAVLAVCFFLFGCSVELKGKGEEPMPDPINFDLEAQSLGLPPRQVLVGTNYAIRVGEKPNDYRVELRTPTDMNLERMDLTQDSVGIVIPHSVDQNVLPGHVYEYRSLSGAEKPIDFKVAIPTDWVIDQAFDIPAGTKSIRFRRVFISSQGLLRMGDAHLRIECEEFYAERGARILTYDRAAVPDTRGRAGGQLEIQAHVMKGDLFIGMNGEEGGPGSDGRPFEKPATDNLRMNNGPAGWPGRPGNPGQDGGDSGALLVTVADSREFRLATEQRAGRGGLPGVGGPGQLGGYGANGLRGTQGPTGVNSTQIGREGKLIGRICLKTPDRMACSPR